MRGTTRIHTRASLVFDVYKWFMEWLCCNKLSLNVSKTHYMILSPRRIQTRTSLVFDVYQWFMEWLSCNKLSLNVLKTHYMKFSPRCRNISNLDVRINNTAIERVNDTKFLGVQIHARLSWKKHIIYTCNKLSIKLLDYTIHMLIHISCIVILCGETPILPVWKKSIVSRKKLVRIITSSPYRALTAPLLIANRLLSVTEITSYMVAICMYNYSNGILPTTFFLNIFK